VIVVQLCQSKKNNTNKSVAYTTSSFKSKIVVLIYMYLSESSARTAFCGMARYAVGNQEKSAKLVAQEISKPNTNPWYKMLMFTCGAQGRAKCH
jgi:hypothetical protein